MKTTRVSHGKISDHFQGLGSASREQVLARAREIALINGRPPNHFTEGDFLDAKHELLGDTESGDATERLTRWDESPDSRGHIVEKTELTDEQDAVAELVEEGLNEAEHDLMVEGAKNHGR